MVYTKTGPKHTGLAGSYVGHHWYDDIEVIQDSSRVMPLTVAHDEVALHKFGCGCAPCTVYPIELLRKLKMRRIRSSDPAPQSHRP